MVCNLTKSRLGGVGAGGLLEGEPRRSTGSLEYLSPLDRNRSAAMRCQSAARRRLCYRMVGRL